MRIRILLLVAFLLLLFYGNQSADEVKYDYIFLLDCSGSMEGKPAGSGNANIFPQVKESVCNFIDNIEMGSTVTIYRFHKGIQAKLSKALTSNEDRKSLKEFVNSSEANGLVTWIYQSLKEALKKTEELRSRSSEKRIQLILLYTDGKDTSPKNVTIDDIIEEFNLQRGENENLYMRYITLGVNLDNTTKTKLTSTPGIMVIENKKGELPQSFLVQVRPYKLYFGNFRDRNESVQTIILNFDSKARGKEIVFKPSFRALDREGVAYEIEPEKSGLSKEIQLKLKLFNKENLLRLATKEFEGTLEISGAEGKTLIVNPSKLQIAFSVEPKKIITVLASKGKRLSKDFGKIRIPEGKDLTYSWPLKLEYNDIANEKNAKVEIWIENDKKNPVKLSPQNIFLQVEGRRIGNKVTIDKTSNLKMDLIVRNKGLRKGKYSGAIILSPIGEDIEIVGNGIQKVTGKKGAVAIPFKFKLLSPPISKWWIYGPLGILVLIILLFLIAKAQPDFYKSAVLQYGDGDFVPLKKKLFKRKYLVSGTKGDFIVSTLPSNSSFYVKPAARGVRGIKVIPKVSSTLKDSAGSDISKMGTILQPDDFIQTADENPIKVTYKILTGED